MKCLLESYCVQHSKSSITQAFTRKQWILVMWRLSQSKCLLTQSYIHSSLNYIINRSYYSSASCFNTYTCASPRILVTGLWNGFACRQLSTMNSSSSSRLKYWFCPWSTWSWWIFWLSSCCHCENSSASCGYNIQVSTSCTYALSRLRWWDYLYCMAIFFFFVVTWSSYKNTNISGQTIVLR